VGASPDCYAREQHLASRHEHGGNRRAQEEYGADADQFDENARENQAEDLREEHDRVRKTHAGGSDGNLVMRNALLTLVVEYGEEGLTEDERHAENRSNYPFAKRRPREKRVADEQRGAAGRPEDKSPAAASAPSTDHRL
jgi:hypothetical protein